MVLSERTVTIFSAISVVSGLALLITSSLILRDYKDAKGLGIGCIFMPNFCKEIDYRVTAASLGIIGALVQIASFALAWMKKTKVFSVLQAVTFVATLVALCLAISSGLHNETEIRGYKARGLAFISVAAIDALYSMLVTGAVCFSYK